MLIRYESHGWRGGDNTISQMNLEDFIRWQCSSKGDYDYDDARSDMQLKLDGSVDLLVNLIKMLLKKGMISLEELHELIPRANYVRLISIDDDWDFSLQRR